MNISSSAWLLGVLELLDDQNLGANFAAI